MCVYDDVGGLAGNWRSIGPEMACGTRACWRQAGPRGFIFRDESASSDGAKSIKLLGGEAGRSMLVVKAGNNFSKGDELADGNRGGAGRLAKRDGADSR